MKFTNQDFNKRHDFDGDPEHHPRLCFLNKKPYIFSSFKTHQYSHLDEVLAFADSYNLDLPKDYIDLLAFANGGFILGQMTPGPADWSGHCEPIKYRPMETRLPRGISRSERSKVIFYSFIRFGDISNGWISIENEPKYLAQGVLIFAQDADYQEVKYFLRCSGSKVGSVYVLNEETNKKKLVSRCFTEFMESFTLVPLIHSDSKPRTLIAYFTRTATIPFEHIPQAVEESEEDLTQATNLALCLIFDGLNTYCQNERKAKKLQMDISHFEPSVFEGYHNLDVQQEAERLVRLIFGKRESRIRKAFVSYCRISPTVAQHLLSMLTGQIVAEFNHTCRTKSFPYFIGTVQAQMEYLSDFLVEHGQYLSSFNKLRSL